MYDGVYIRAYLLLLFPLFPLTSCISLSAHNFDAKPFRCGVFFIIMIFKSAVVVVERTSLVMRVCARCGKTIKTNTKQNTHIIHPKNALKTYYTLRVFVSFVIVDQKNAFKVGRVENTHIVLREYSTQKPQKEK